MQVRNQSWVGTGPPATATPPWPAGVAPGVGAHVVPGRQSWEKRLLAACGVMDALPHQALAGAGGVGLVSPGTRHRQLRVCETAAHPAGWSWQPRRTRAPWPTPARSRGPRAPPCPPWRGRARVPQGVERGAEGLAHGGRQRGQWPRALDARGAEAMAEAPRPARAHPLGGAVEAIRHDAPAPIGRIVRKRGARERLRGLVVRKNYGNDSFVGTTIRCQLR